MKSNTSEFAWLLGFLIVLMIAAIGAGTYLYIAQVAKPKPAAVVQKTSEKPADVASTTQSTIKNQQAAISTPPVAVDTSASQAKIQSDQCQDFLNKTDNELKLAKLPDDCGKIINVGNGLKWKYIQSDYNWDIDNDPYTGPVLTIWDEQGKFVQKVTETFENAWYFYAGGISFEDDINFDGYKDLKIMVNSGPGAGIEIVSYNYWIFNPATRKFKKDEVLAHIVNPKFNNDKKTIISGVGVGNRCFSDPTCIGGMEIIYKFNNRVWENAYNAVNLPKFEDFPAKEIYTGQPVAVYYENSPKMKEFDENGGASGGYKSLITDEVAKGPNFNNHYRLIDWSCGSSCRAAAIIDVSSGEIVYSPFIGDKNNRPNFDPWENLNYQVNSSLLVVNGEYYDWLPNLSSKIYVEGLQ